MTDTPEALVKAIKRKTRKKHESEEKIRIVLEGLRGEESIAELCRIVCEGLKLRGHVNSLRLCVRNCLIFQVVVVPTWQYR